MSAANREHVIAALKSMRLLGEDGTMGHIDSLSAVDLTLDLEARVGFEIPSERLRPEHFVSIETIAALLDEVAQAGK
ncbi:MAG TPA: acyl carrier protein [Kofleriaceae bacterium]|jgi:acyl carrier protein